MTILKSNMAAKWSHWWWHNLIRQTWKACRHFEFCFYASYCIGYHSKCVKGLPLVTAILKFKTAATRGNFFACHPTLSQKAWHNLFCTTKCGDSSDISFSKWGLRGRSTYNASHLEMVACDVISEDTIWMVIPQNLVVATWILYLSVLDQKLLGKMGLKGQFWDSRWRPLGGVFRASLYLK